jgi:hypothetical protein
MATKSQRFKNEQVQAARAANPRAKKVVKKKRLRTHGRNLSQHAERTALVAYEPSDTKPSRRSTRKSHLHMRASSPLERKEQLRRSNPETRARSAQAKSTKVRGKRK